MNEILEEDRKAAEEVLRIANHFYSEEDAKERIAAVFARERASHEAEGQDPRGREE